MILFRRIFFIFIALVLFSHNHSEAENKGVALKIVVNFPLEKIQPKTNFKRIYFHNNTNRKNKVTLNFFQKIDSTQVAKRKEKRQYKIEHSFDHKKFLPMYFLGFGEVGAFHVASIIVLFLAPVEYTQWDYGLGRELLENSHEKFIRAWTTPPVKDRDTWNTNWVAHPYAGGYYYNFVRSNGASPLGSFLFSAFASTAWEYGLEAMYEQPSIQDLWITPVIGAMVGEASHQITLSLLKNKFTVGEKLLMLLIDPAYFLNHGFRVPTEQRRKQLRQWNTNK